MAKTSLKNQLKQQNMANTTGSLLVNTDLATTTKIIPPDVTSSPTHVTFHDFIKLANIETINHFLVAATSTLESENIETLWKREYDEGYKNGRKSVLQDLGRKMEGKFEEGVMRGKDLGCEEGYMIAKEAFNRMVMKLKARETLKTSTIDVDTQMDTPVPTMAWHLFLSKLRPKCPSTLKLIVPLA